jgi:hypothetical protein
METFSNDKVPFYHKFTNYPTHENAFVESSEESIKRIKIFVGEVNVL